MLEVFEIGTKVSLNQIGWEQGIEAIVIAILIRNGNVQYLCSWWDDKMKREDWIDAIEIAMLESTITHKVSFKPVLAG